ncbi:hypothetical protein O181_048250 [Austropuccinia psidii MF-1]|uniref:Reverse transcriptase Ty1/copia-type domain-containing protein n=1 Tax=Austropuccinia psidii MF-1 TaxID=1389203 RepID=A0A9Q3DWW2_9BASI|nr:hypothetical protein [Austropuccinia psidii MF-1]
MSPTPSRGNKTPYQLWSNNPPRLSRLRIFGCRAVIFNLKSRCSWKLAPPGQEGVLLGFENENTSYQILRLSDLKVIVTRNATFNEKVFPYVLGGKNTNLWAIETMSTGRSLDEIDVLPVEMNGVLSEQTEASSEGPNLAENIGAQQETTNEQTINDENSTQEGMDDQQQVDSSTGITRIRVIGPRHPTIITSNVDPLHILPYKRRAVAYLSIANNAPATYQSALKSENKEAWVLAIEKELTTMNNLNLKRDHQNTVIEHKARLCAQGFTQTPGIDFDKTYAPTGRLNSLRALIAHACANNLDFHQIDVKSAFLNAPLKETVYLSIPQGLDLNRQQYYLRLKNSIYGLKQAPLAWYTRLKTWLLDTGFVVCKLDPCVFYRKTPDQICIYVHVDDMAIFGQSLQSFKEQINKEFQIKDLGPADLLLGVKVNQSQNFITLNQQHFIKSLLHSYGMQECKIVSTPLVPNLHLGPATEDERKVFEAIEVNYRSAIGSINYLSTATRPDLSFAVSCLSQYLEKPGIQHWKAFLHVLKYLRGTQDVGLCYMRNKKSGLVAFSDADWGNCQETQRSTSGFLAQMHGCLIFWKTRKQPSVSISTAEAEYKSLCDLTSELLWFCQWCQEAEIYQFDNVIIVWEDNQSCISTANGNCNLNNKRMKHVDIQLHFVKEAVQSNFIKLQYAPTLDMLADFLTKSVTKTNLQRALTSLGVCGLGVRGGVKNQAMMSLG